MAETTHAVIVIQARTGSERFPAKVLEDLEGKPVLQHVIDTCRASVSYLNQHVARSGLMASVVLAIPEGDSRLYPFRSSLPIVEGSEGDVLARYLLAAEKTKADYICRVTGDCPLVIGPMINHAIKTAVINRYDYLSNVDEKTRVVPDGWDVEVFSRGLLEFTAENATDPGDREHVTTFMRRSPPYWATKGFQQSWLGLALSGLKLSIDTEEDLARVRPLVKEFKRLQEIALKEYGKNGTHRF